MLSPTKSEGARPSHVAADGATTTLVIRFSIDVTFPIISCYINHLMRFKEREESNSTESQRGQVSKSRPLHRDQRERGLGISHCISFIGIASNRIMAAMIDIEKRLIFVFFYFISHFYFDPTVINCGNLDLAACSFAWRHTKFDSR